ncbi:MAG: CoA transferase [Dehalococcoidales bacterium]|nr:CoA transferase [Dehalococcoidales bacterium]
MQHYPLEGIRVTDFTNTLVGPHMVQWLAVMGAEVIKVESKAWVTGSGLSRPKTDGGQAVPNIQPILNFSKKRCTLNLKQPEAVELAKRLISLSDLVVDNYSGGVMDRIGLGYSVLKEIKPDIIMLSTSAVGSKGPLSSLPGYGPTVDAWGGLDGITGYFGGHPDCSGNTGWTDMVTAQYGAFAILVALRHRARTGQGQYIDLAMAEAVACRIPEALMDYIMNGTIRKNVGNRDDHMAPHNTYPCQGEDKWVAIAVATQEEWRALCQAMGNPAWCQEARFADEISRWHHQDELDKLIAEWTRQHTNYEVMEILQRAGVAAGPSLGVDEFTADPHLKERGFFIEIDQPGSSKIWPALPWKQTPALKGKYQPAVQQGEHNNYVFGQLLGIPPAEIARLVEEQIIF